MKIITWKSIISFVLAVILQSIFFAIPISVSAASKDTGSVLFGRSALFVGDSITAGSRDSSPYKGWAGRVGHKHNMHYINAGVGGSSISTCRSKGTGRIIDQLNKHEGKTFDYVIMHGGVNDAWDLAPVGKMTEGFDTSTFDIDSFAGGLEETFARAKELFPDATLGFILNNALPKCPYGTISNMALYMAVATQICEKWGVEYLALYNDMDFCYYVLKVNTLEYFGDDYYCHPNAAGYDLIAPLVEEWMESLPHPDNPTEDEFLPEPPDDFIGEDQTSEAPEAVTDEKTTAEHVTTDENTREIGCASVVSPITGILVTVAAGVAWGQNKKKNSGQREN